jgi:dTDP-4-dehydrorhamnose reductase
MKVLLTGASGQLGQELQKLRPYSCPNSRELDITDPDSVAKYLGRHAFDLIVHGAAYTDTLKPDHEPAEAYKCFKTNVLGTRNIVNQATCPIIYISTESAIEPYNFYILTKMQGEHEVKLHKYGYRIIRTSFRSDPFEYPKAPTDMYTLADVVSKIAPLIDQAVDTPMDNDIVYIGTAARTVYELAKETRPDVIGLPRSEIYNRLPSMEGLRDVV